MVKRVSGFIVGPAWSEFMHYALTKLPTGAFARGNYPEAQKPALRGLWQVPGSDGTIHEILYWVNKTDPAGPPPSNPASDSQFERWDLPVRAWAAQNGFINIAPGSIDTTPPPSAIYSPSGGAVIPGYTQ
jgi:hypothetical protein